MSRYEKWFDEMSRTIISRNIHYSAAEMVYHGIVEIINCESGLDSPEQMEERMRYVSRKGQAGHNGRIVLVDSCLRSQTGINTVRVYSGIVFRAEWLLNLYVTRHKHMFGDISKVPAFVN